MALLRWGVYGAMYASASHASHLYLEPAVDHGAPDLEVGQPALPALSGYLQGMGCASVGWFEVDGCKVGFWFQRGLPLVGSIRVI